VPAPASCPTGIPLARTLPAGTHGQLLVGYSATLLYGLLAVGNENLNWLSLNWADNCLHLASVLLGLVIALLPVRRSTAASR
jgi:ABC-type uncharacterized transport system permease subunit